MQAYSPTLPVGTQRHYTSLLHALRSIYTQDGGLRGLFRGVPTAVVRTSMGTSFQMPSYFWMKHQLQSSGFNGFGAVVASSVFAGAVVVSPNYRLVSMTLLKKKKFIPQCTTMQAADTTLTRLCVCDRHFTTLHLLSSFTQVQSTDTSTTKRDQHRHSLYRSNRLLCQNRPNRGPSCVVQRCVSHPLESTGDFHGYNFSVGSLAHLLRVAPHITIVLTANEAITRTWKNWKIFK